jgi:tRNA splicing endonuclease
VPCPVPLLAQPSHKLQLYEHGFYGKGTVSRRVPNRGAFEVITGEDEKGDDAKRRRLDPDAPPPDLLRGIAMRFEEERRGEALPEAYWAAASAVSDGQTPMPFDAARVLAHYISCPPPRTRHLTPAPSSSSATASVEAGQRRPREAAVPGVKLVRETAILEPEAAQYLLDRFPDRLAVFRDVTTEKQAASLSDSSALSSPLLSSPFTASELWTALVSSIPNFVARYAVYRLLRDRGWVVRDGSAFGSDFALYGLGPGGDHAPHCITVMPLRLRVTGDAGVPVETVPSVQARPPARSVVKNWQELHAVSRVVSSVKKNTILAYCTADTAAPSYAACEGQYPLDIFGRFGSSTCVDELDIQFTWCARWHLAHEMMRKTAAVMQHVAATSVQTGVNIDLGAFADKSLAGQGHIGSKTSKAETRKQVVGMLRATAAVPQQSISVAYTVEAWEGNTQGQLITSMGVIMSPDGSSPLLSSLLPSPHPHYADSRMVPAI